MKNPLQEGHNIRTEERAFPFHVLLVFYIINMFCFYRWFYNPIYIVSLSSFSYHQAFLKTAFGFVAILLCSI